MNTARLLVPIFTLRDFLYLLLDFLLAGFLQKVFQSCWFLWLIKPSSAAQYTKSGNDHRNGAQNGTAPDQQMFHYGILLSPGLASHMVAKE